MYFQGRISLIFAAVKYEDAREHGERPSLQLQDVAAEVLPSEPEAHVSNANNDAEAANGDAPSGGLEPITTTGLETPTGDLNDSALDQNSTAKAAEEEVAPAGATAMDVAGEDTQAANLAHAQGDAALDAVGQVFADGEEHAVGAAGEDTKDVAADDNAGEVHEDAEDAAGSAATNAEPAPEAPSDQPDAGGQIENVDDKAGEDAKDAAGSATTVAPAPEAPSDKPDALAQFVGSSAATEASRLSDGPMVHQPPRKRPRRGSPTLLKEGGEQTLTKAAAKAAAAKEGRGRGRGRGRKGVTK